MLGDSKEALGDGKEALGDGKEALGDVEEALGGLGLVARPTPTGRQVNKANLGQQWSWREGLSGSNSDWGGGHDKCPFSALLCPFSALLIHGRCSTN